MSIKILELYILQKKEISFDISFFCKMSLAFYSFNTLKVFLLSFISIVTKYNPGLKPEISIS